MLSYNITNYHLFGLKNDVIFHKKHYYDASEDN